MLENSNSDTIVLEVGGLLPLRRPIGQRELAPPTAAINSPFWMARWVSNNSLLAQIVDHP